jgi:hypothetical protein
MNLNFRSTIITQKNYYKMNQKILNPLNCNLLKSAHFYLRFFGKELPLIAIKVPKILYSLP